MLYIEFAKNLSEKEIELISKTLRELSKKIYWRIIKRVILEPNICQTEIAQKVNRKNISSEMNFLVKQGFIRIAEDIVDENPMNNCKRYTVLESDFIELVKGYTSVERYRLQKMYSTH